MSQAPSLRPNAGNDLSIQPARCNPLKDVCAGGFLTFLSRWRNHGLEWEATPPCFLIPGFEYITNSNKFCDIIGSCGLPGWANANRAPLMFYSAWMSIVMFFFYILALCSLALDNQTVQDLFWIKGEGDLSSGETLSVYLSIARVVYSSNGVTGSFDWDDTKCITTEGWANPDLCDACNTAAFVVGKCLIISFITEFPSFTTKLCRSTEKHDINCQKLFGMVTAVLGALGNLSVLAVLTNECYKELPDTTTRSDVGTITNLTYQWGPAFVFMVIATILKFCEIFVQAVLPVGRKLSRSYLKSLGPKSLIKDTEMGNSSQN